MALWPVPPGGPASGDLEGTYPSPTIAAALDDPVATTPGLRTLGTGAAQAAAGTHNHDSVYIPSGLVDAKGDLIVATADNTVARVAAGTRHHVLTADPAATSGVAWTSTPQVVTSTASITTPYTGQVILNTTDMLLYRYTGSAWIGFHAVGGTTTTTRHEARYAHTTAQSILNATDTKLRFQTAVTTCDDVTPSGTGNQDFLLVRAGLWSIDGCMRLVSGTGGERHFFILTGTTITTITARIASSAAGNVGSAAATMNCSATIAVSANTSICAGVWHSNGTSLNTDVAFGNMCHIAFTWLRPSS